MLVVETIARIRREHFIKGKTIKEIARNLRVPRNTVRKVLRSGGTSFEYEREVQSDRSLASGLASSARCGAWADEGYNHPATGGQLQAFNYTGGATRSGWLVGAGFEYGFTPNWSALIEYNYIDFGTNRTTLNEVSGRFVTFDMNQTLQTVKVGLNYRFGGGPVVAKY